MTDDKKNRGGRPWLTEEQKTIKKEKMLLKMEPYLKSGLSVNKALRATKIAHSEFYKYIAEDRLFGQNVARFKQYIAVLVNNIIFHVLITIIKKQNGDEVNGIEAQDLSKDDTDFLWRYAIYSNLCREEWGRRANVATFDPEAEIQRLKRMFEVSTKIEIARI